MQFESFVDLRAEHIVQTAALEPKGANPAFNVINGDVEPWHNMWPKVAKRFSCQIPRNQFKVDRGKDADTVMKIAEKAPLAEVAAQVRLEGNLRQNQVKQKIELIKWSRRDVVQKAWQKLEK